MFKTKDGLLGRADGPCLATPAEADSWERAAGVRVVAIRRVVDLRAGDGGVEGLDGGGGTVHDGGARVNDGLDAGVGRRRADDGVATGRLPEAAAGDGVVLNRAGVERSVGTTEEQ